MEQPAWILRHWILLPEHNQHLASSDGATNLRLASAFHTAQHRVLGLMLPSPDTMAQIR